MIPIQFSGENSLCNVSQYETREVLMGGEFDGSAAEVHGKVSVINFYLQ